MSLPNKLTIFRILLIPFFLITLLRPPDEFLMTLETRIYRSLPLIIFFIAMVTDVLDGFLARRSNQHSSLGRFLDPFADKLFLLSAFIVLSFMNRIPAWITAVVIVRDVIIVIGWAIIFVISGRSVISPSIYGKLTTFFQSATVLAVLLNVSCRSYIWHTAAFFTIVSGIDYTLKGSTHVNTED
ncbi:MAG: CDP-diacylglycerol--glycerol-3-phosphate 3-phosphatidyltransferase [bacterium]